MNGSDQDTIRCDYEHDYFPKEQFEEDPEWGLVHNKDPRHTVRGTVLDNGSNGPTPEAEPDHS
jgi:hypothetical protein